MTGSMVKEHTLGKMVVSTRVSGLMESSTERECIVMRMGRSGVEDGKRVNELPG